jgi:hypothetical protein
VDEVMTAPQRSRFWRASSRLGGEAMGAACRSRPGACQAAEDVRELEPRRSENPLRGLGRRTSEPPRNEGWRENARDAGLRRVVLAECERRSRRLDDRGNCEEEWAPSVAARGTIRRRRAPRRVRARAVAPRAFGDRRADSDRSPIRCSRARTFATGDCIR